MNWKELFKPHILERGYDYYRSGKVEILEKSDNEVDAVVSGSDEYYVNIRFSHGDVDEVYCDCPYANDGYDCKHMAAVLYALEAPESIHSTYFDDTEKMINEAEPELIREFLNKAVRYDEELKDKFVRFLKSKNDQIKISEYKSHLESLILRYSDEYGYIDWRSTYCFFNDVKELLTECTEKLIEENRLFDAFEIVKYYYGKIIVTDIDDDGDICAFQNTCLEILQQIAELSDMDTKRKLFETSLEMLSQKFGDLSDMFLYYIKNCFTETEFLDAMLEYSGKRLSMKCSDYELEKWALYHLKLMDLLKYDDEKIMHYAEKYLHFSGIRNYLTERYVSKDHFKTAIKILENSLECVSTSIRDSKNVHMKLKELYRQNADKKNYIRELWIILTEYDLTDIDVYVEFKSLFDADEWEEVRERLYSSMKNQAMLPEYFIEEQLTDRLASYIYANKSIYLIEQYEPYLIKDYSEFILSEYADYLNSAAKQTADRSTYRRWADKLRHMKKIKGGKECVDEIIYNWSTIYRNRPAMMQEISNVYDED